MRGLRAGCAAAALMAACGAPTASPDLDRPPTPIDTGPSVADAAPVAPVPPPAAVCPWDDAFQNIGARQLEVVWLTPPSTVGTLRGRFEALSAGTISMAWEQRDERGRMSGADDYGCGARGVMLRMSTADDVSMSFDPPLTVLNEPGVGGTSSGRVLVVSGDQLSERSFTHRFDATIGRPPERWRDADGTWIAMSSELVVEGGDIWHTDTLWYASDELLVPVRRVQRVDAGDGATWERTEQADWWGLSQ